MNLEKDNPKSIKSFVRRAGRMTPSQKRALESCWPTWGIEFRCGLVDLPNGFDALKLEIGFGNGDALIEMASQDPRSLYLGIEVHLPGVGRCLNRIEQLELENLRLIRHDAIEVMETVFAPGRSRGYCCSSPIPGTRSVITNGASSTAAFATWCTAA